MSDRRDADICDICRQGRIAIGNEELAFHQWTDLGYVFCRVSIPMATCDRCGAKSWDEAAEAIIEDAVRREYAKLP